MLLCTLEKLSATEHLVSINKVLLKYGMLAQVCIAIPLYKHRAR